MQEFSSLTPEEGRKMIRSARVLLLPNWDIVDAMVFNTITKKLSTEEKKKRALNGAKYNEDHATLVIFSKKRGLICTHFLLSYHHHFFLVLYLGLLVGVQSHTSKYLIYIISLQLKL